eukprot:7121332-Pyramimonas_sp.AAC.1
MALAALVGNGTLGGGEHSHCTIGTSVLSQKPLGGSSTKPPLVFIHGSYHAAWCVDNPIRGVNPSCCFCANQLVVLLLPAFELIGLMSMA